MKKYITILCLLFLITSCKENNEASTENVIATHISNAAVQVSFEGKLHTIEQDDLSDYNKTLFEENKIQFNFWEDGQEAGHYTVFNPVGRLIEMGQGNTTIKYTYGFYRV